ncbi:serine/threonine-protein phosphatase [Geitlerinema sp. P-1104]|uniref:protein phosphatase 2C domain-containing protein n=1 Tax=Geitlerinema sp. P-1104 TaxID=2546230 RepID=UPI001476A522|nr:serine/threonine-protein phosphatase [Geitlerinema sp. P-1104]
MLFREFANRIDPPETTLPHYLWAVGQLAAQIPAGELLGDRYEVLQPQIWCDRHPDRAPDLPDEISLSYLPYLRLVRQKLHVPQIYGIYTQDSHSSTPIVLLDNAPITPEGQLYPSLREAWANAPAVRQVYWLWQSLQLWPILDEQGVAASLLNPENLRVQSWRIWLLQLHSGNTGHQLTDLGYHWSNWLSGSSAIVAEPMMQLCQRMREGDSFSNIEESLNQLLLELAAERPLLLEIYGDSDPGPLRSHNEDACYPTTTDRNHPEHYIRDLAILCDGVGGHEGGEVASQTAVRTLTLQIRELSKSIQLEANPLPPKLIAEQLAALVRVANNTIAHQNDSQEREARQRMGTTLVLAWQLGQSLRNDSGVVRPNSHELYLVNIGDSRAYWLTAHHCQQLTVDDDVAHREVEFGRCFGPEAFQQMGAGALTQALGTRDSEFLHPSIQRFIIEEDGILLLCSDGLSDDDWVEKSWQQVAPAVLAGDCALNDAVQAWIQLANEQNGHDNTSVVMMLCRVSPPPRKPVDPVETNPDFSQSPPDSEFSEASKALLYDQATDVPGSVGRRRRRTPAWQTGLGVILMILLGVGVFVLAYQQMRPQDDSTPSFPEAPAPED